MYKVGDSKWIYTGKGTVRRTNEADRRVVDAMVAIADDRCTECQLIGCDCPNSVSELEVEHGTALAEANGEVRRLMERLEIVESDRDDFRALYRKAIDDRSTARDEAKRWRGQVGL